MQVQSIFLRHVAPALTLALLVGGSGAIVSPQPVFAATLPADQAVQTIRPVSKAIQEYRSVYIIGFKQAPLGRYAGEDAVYDAPEREANGRIVDVESTAATRYVAHLQDVQSTYVANAAAQLGRALTPTMSFQHAFNGVVLSLSQSEAEYFRSRPEVALVEEYTEYEMDTDAGPSLIGAPGIWDGSSVPSGVSTRGEGIVIGVIDSGINFDSPSFAATEPGSSLIPGGFVHSNPLGAGTYLGTCAPGGVDAALCNDKVIGAYDFVFTVHCPGGTCPTGTIDEASVEDTNGHGTHTASTAGGNAVDATFQGAVIPMAGVARHANIIAYDACYTRLSDNGGLCPNVSTLASVNRAVADGLVDVINYSIGGGAQPWSESVSLAFLTAHNAGIFVSASAGNSGPGASTLGHVEPWVASVAASTHSRKLGFDFDLTGPAAPPANTQNIIVAPGGTPYAAASLVDVPLIVSPGFVSATNNDACAAFPAGTFQRAGVGGIAVVRFTTATSACGSGTRRTNVLNAGAVGLLFVVDGPTGFIASGTTWQMNLSDWTPVHAHLNTDPTTATATITAPFAAYPSAQQPDVLAGFSSRGPSGFDLLKPDVMAPGVDILAAYSGAASSVNVISGTSMAAPHNAGAAALLRALNPSWTPSEIKSALMGTAKTTALFKEDAVTPATPLDRGAGRVDLSAAGRAGLIFDETGANFLAANPAAGGDPATLNVASIQNDSCVGTCTFTRTVRNARTGAMTYSLAFSGPIAAAASVTPNTFTIATSGTRSFTVSIDSTLLPPGTFAFGELSMTPSNPALPTVRLPIAVRASLQEISVAPTSLQASAVVDTTTTQPLAISNVGNPTLNWSIATGSQTAVLLDLPATNSGERAQFFTSFSGGEYVAEDFLVPGNASITTLRANGFVLPGGINLAGVGGVARGADFFVYADDEGVPAGAPELGGSTPPIWTFSSLFASPGVPTPGINMSNNNIVLDLAAASAPALNLTPGRYWVIIVPRLSGNGSGGTAANALWAWRSTGAISEGAPPVTIFPLLGDTDWLPTGSSGMSTTITATVACGVPWASTDITTGALGLAGQSNLTVTFDATGLAPATHQGALCVASNDPATPIAVVPVTFNVAAPPTNPTATGAASPAARGATETSLLTVTVVPGTSPTSSGVTVTANLGSIGGSATQAFLDNGVAPDASAGDGIYSYLATVAAGSAVGPTSFAVSVQDAQSRSAATSIAFEVLAATNPSGVGAASPASVPLGGSTVLTVDTTGGANPPSTGLAVTVDLSSIGGSATQAFVDDGNGGDATAGDGEFSFTANIPVNAVPGAKSLPATISDAQTRSGNATIALTLTSIAGPSGIGAAAPSAVASGGNALLTVTVTSGSPVSTGVTVTVDLTAVGGSATQAMFDDGTNGDMTPGDNVYSVSAPITAADGSYNLTATIRDAQARSATAVIQLGVGDGIFGHGFED